MKTNRDKKRYLTLRQLAEISGHKYHKLDKWCRRGLILPIKQRGKHCKRLFSARNVKIIQRIDKWRRRGWPMHRISGKIKSSRYYMNLQKV